jgi:phosphomannomutase
MPRIFRPTSGRRSPQRSPWARLRSVCARRSSGAEQIEDRGSQVTFSALGQEAPVASKGAWDPDDAKKRKLRDYVANELPEFEVRIGGSTSIDVTKRGIDKAYGIKKLIGLLDVKKEDILFVGDRLQEGGNDHPVEAMGVDCLNVSGWRETALVIETILEVT